MEYLSETSQLYPTSADSFPHGGAAALLQPPVRGPTGEPAPASDVPAGSRTGFATTGSPPFQEERGHSPLIHPDGAGPVGRTFTVFRSDMKDS